MYYTNWNMIYLRHEFDFTHERTSLYQDSRDTQWILHISRLSWHDNRWWSTSRSLENRPLRNSTSRLFVDKGDEEEPRATRERWSAEESVFINSTLKNFPTGAEDRRVGGEKEGKKNEGEKQSRRIGPGIIPACSESRLDAHVNAWPRSRTKLKEGTCNLHNCMAETADVEANNFTMVSALCPKD